MKDNGDTLSVTVLWENLLEFTSETLRAVGMSRPEAESTADTLVLADLRGFHSHGVMRLPIYVRRIESGVVKARANVVVLREDRGTALIDGGNGMGQVASIKAMELCVQKATEHGSAWVGVRNSNHNGAALYYTLMAARHDMIGIAMTDGAQNIMAPWGGRTKLLGTNPLSVAVPTRGVPLVLDTAFTVASIGRVVEAMKRGNKIPRGWAINERGEPTADPVGALAGTLLPIGDYKGYGLALVVSVLSSVLTGAAFGQAVPPFWTDFSHPQNTGHLMGAIAVRCFADVDEFKDRTEALICELRHSELAEGFERVFVPGERGFETEKQYRENGVPIIATVYDELMVLKERFGLRAALS
jgi:LDH2 family malate/lactate/ureidoglycolate dehydrogenase